MPWFVPLIASLIGSGISAATSISTGNQQIAEQERQFKEQQRLQEEAINNERIRQQQQQQINNQQINNQQTVNQFAQTLNKGYSTGITGNQMGAGIGIGVQGLNTTGYLNEPNFMAAIGGKFNKKDNAKTNVSDNNRLYFDRIEYAKCGGRFARK